MAESVFPILKSRVGVYLIVSPTNGRYVGSSKRLDKRFNRYKNLSCSKQSAIYASLKKYGYENHKFSILFYCEEVDLFFWERCFGDIYLSSANFSQGLNIVLPGYDDVPQHRTKEFNERVSLIQKKRFENPEARKKAGEYSRIAYSDPALRKRHSETLTEVYKNPLLRQKRSELQKEYFSSPDARKKASEATKKYLLENPEQKNKNYSALVNYYNKHPEKRGAYMKKLHKNNPNAGKEHGKKLIKLYQESPHLREIAAEKTRKQIAKNGHHASKPVINTETGEIYPHLKGLAESLKIPVQTFRNWLKGKSTNKTPYIFLENKKTA